MPDAGLRIGAATASLAAFGPWLKGFPVDVPPLDRDALVGRGWNVLAGDLPLPLPLAVIKRSALAHNLRWMQDFAAARGLDLAPHGKTTMSPELFRRQLDAGAWGLTFANVHQLRVGVQAGVRRALIANQVVAAADLDGLAHLLHSTPGLRVVFLVDSAAQLALIESWRQTRTDAPMFEVLLEVGIAAGRTGVRAHADAITLARALRASPALRLVGLECYEGLQATGDDERDRAHVDALMQRFDALAVACDAESLFEADEIILSAGGSALFDLVAAGLKPRLSRPVRALLRSGCYVSHDHGHYRRLVQRVALRCGCADALHPALEVWTTVQSTPEPGLALLNAGRRDVSFDIELPHVIAHAPAGVRQAAAAPAHWRIAALNDQHAHLRFDPTAGAGPAVGDRIGLGISHPCTTFDKWRWMVVVDEDYGIVDANTTAF